MSKHGPFERYTEVETEWGTFGVQPGQAVVIDAYGVHPADDEQPDLTDGSVADVVARVEAGAQDAADTLLAEQAKANPRTTLIAALEDLIGGEDAAEEASDEAEGDDAEAPQDADS